MLESEVRPLPSESEQGVIFRRAPIGALLIAGISTFIVFLLWLLFYLLVFVPRGMLR